MITTTLYILYKYMDIPEFSFRYRYGTHRFSQLFAFIAIFALITTGCDLFGGGDNGNGEGSGINNGLSGTLYFDSPRDYVAFDVSSGSTSVVREGAAGAGIKPSADASEFVVIEGSRHEEQVVIFRRDGEVTHHIPIEGRLTGFPRLSPEGGLIALSRDFGASTVVFDRNGDIVRNLGRGLGTQTWLPDGRLAYTRAETVFAANINAGTEELIRSFSGRNPAWLTVSRDGFRFAWIMDDENGQRALWIMNADAEDLRLLATSVREIHSPAWSPDGRYIALRKGTAVGQPGNGGCPELWVIPSDTEMTNLSASDPAPAFSLQQPGEFSDLRSVCAFGPPEWRP